MRPFLSVVVPVYNREKFVRRSIDSILRQKYTDYEILAINDGSQDRSGAVLRSYDVDHPGFRVLEHATNQGVMAARQTAWQAARGQWIVWLDSDDELVEGALAMIHARLADTPPEISFAQFQCMLDGWLISPDPPFARPCVLDYHGYLESLEDHFGRRYDTLHCMRVGTEPELSTTGLEDLFCLDFHERWTSVVYPEVVLLYHQDAGNQLSKAVAASPHDDPGLTQAQIDHLERLLAAHGGALRIFAPRWFHRYASHLATLQFALGRRRQGIRYSVQALRIGPTYARSWVVPLLGLCSGNVLVWCRAAKRRLRRMYA